MGESRAVQEGREKAEAIRYQHRFGLSPIRDLFGFIERSFPELLVGRYPMADGPDGALVREGNRWLGVVNTYDRLLIRQRFTACHELAHFLFDRFGDPLLIDQDLWGPDPRETRANAFAVHLILPGEALLAKVRDPKFDLNDENDLVLLSMEYGLSLSSLSFHLMNICGISKAKREWISTIEPFKVAGRNGLVDRVRQEIQAKDAIRMPRLLISNALRARELGLLTDAEVTEIIQDPAFLKDVHEASKS